MELRINGASALLPGESVTAERLVVLLTELAERGEVVQRVLLDGEEVDWALEELMAAVASGTGQHLDLRTAPAASLLSETIHETAQSLPDLGQDLHQIAILLRQGKDGDAFSQLSTTVENLQSYAALLEFLAQQPLTAQDRSEAEKQVGAIQTWLQQIMEAWQHEDYVLVADLLFYELTSQVEEGYRWMVQLAGPGGAAAEAGR